MVNKQTDTQKFQILAQNITNIFRIIFVDTTSRYYTNIYLFKYIKQNVK